ncbi:hypothetical protein [Dietzia cercidiphylli]|uniref:hypothetical protein n=1 Tax=Dietzia cercidiphylli TaxID=498199 RepID=UPI00223A6D86|nr:hypothetical protein [Dietzia cercidiphylli]MCT1515302.1 hypothetical protein [Dietzia cercidiphylli]
MARQKSRQASPDGRIEVDKSSGRDGTGLSKTAVRVSEEEFLDRAATRAGARSLDAKVESSGAGRGTKDAQRSFPRPADGPVSPRKQRPLQHAGITRTPPSSRQRKERSATKNRVWSQQPTSVREAVTGLVSGQEQWKGVSERLAATAGDLQTLSESDRLKVQRVDRFIQSYERESGREHVLYMPVSLPDGASSIREIGTQLPDRSTVSLDRFGYGSHSLHELDAMSGHGDTVFEVSTSRGAYLGGSDSVDDTRHITPRGMVLRIAGKKRVSYQRPDGSIGERIVVQCRDVTEARHEKNRRHRDATSRRRN